MRLVYLIIGVISFVVGTIGIFLPVLPTVPLYLLAIMCFAKSSQRLHDKLVNSELYQKHVACFSRKRGIPLVKKFKIVLTTLLIMGIAFYFCPNPIGKAVIVVCYVIHVGIIFFYLPTLKPNKAINVDNK